MDKNYFYILVYIYFIMIRIQVFTYGFFENFNIDKMLLLESMHSLSAVSDLAYFSLKQNWFHTNFSINEKNSGKFYQTQTLNLELFYK